MSSYGLICPNHMLKRQPDVRVGMMALCHDNIISVSICPPASKQLLSPVDHTVSNNILSHFYTVYILRKWPSMLSWGGGRLSRQLKNITCEGFILQVFYAFINFLSLSFFLLPSISIIFYFSSYSTGFFFILFFFSARFLFFI